MVDVRRKYTPFEEVSLLAQVEGHCPICGMRLDYKKKGRTYKAYELAHIYPLNPKRVEVEELKGVIKHFKHVNDPENILPLCLTCHGKIDKPRTRDEYEGLVEIKGRGVQILEQHKLQKQYTIEPEIEQILAGLQDEDVEQGAADLQFDVKRLAEKFPEDTTTPLRRKITHCVQDYHSYIRDKLKEIERDNPSASDLLCSQIRIYYLKQKELGLPPSAVFDNIVDWMTKKETRASRESGEAVAAYYVQNCEVFE